MGEDINFTTWRVKSWKTDARVDKLVDFFTHKIEEARLIGVEPIKLVPTRINSRVGNDSISKRWDKST